MNLGPSKLNSSMAKVRSSWHGQTAAQTEADRQDCNRWATTQRDAMSDAGIFHRASLACLEGRGYTVR